MNTRNHHINESEMNILSNLGVDATTTIEGVTQVATFQEALAGEVDNKVVTPSVLRELLVYLGLVDGTIPGGSFWDTLNDTIGTSGVPFQSLNDYIDGPFESLNNMSVGD